MEYYISRAEKIHGPTGESEMRTWLAYGSLKPDDLVRRAHEQEWLPLKRFPEFNSTQPVAAEPPSRWAPRAGTWRPNAGVRHYDINHVPDEQCSGVVIWRLLSGFVCRPLTLWRTAGTVCRLNVYVRAKDERGFLRTWPRWMRAPVTVLVVAHALLWTGIACWTMPQVTSLAGIVVEHTREAWHEATMEMPPPASAAQ
jgi:hypothetical protein